MAALERVETSPEVQRLVSMMDQAPLVNPSLWAGFKSTGGLYTPDEVVNKRGWEIYDEMIRRDPLIGTYSRFLKFALVSGGFEVLPGDDTPEAEKRAEEMRGLIETLFDGDWLDVPRQMMSAFHDGVSINEKIHAVCDEGEHAGKTYLKQFRDKHPQHFHFDQDVYGNLLPDGLVQFWGEGAKEKRLNPDDFVIYSHDSAFGNIYGRSMLQPIYEAFFARQVLPRQINVGIEKAGIGGLQITVPKGTTPEQMAAVLARARLLHGSSIFVKIEGETWEPIPFDGKGIEAGLKALDRYDREVSRGFGLPELLFNIGSSGSYALSEVQLEVALVECRGYQRQHDDKISTSIFWPIDQANNGPGPSPRHALKAVDMGGIKSVFAKWEAMSKVNAKPTLETVARETGYAITDLEDKPEPVLPFGAPGAPPVPGDKGALPERRARVGNGEDAEQLSERAMTRPESRVNLSELTDAHEKNATHGAAALRSAIRAETERLTQKLRESDVARRPLAPTRSGASSGRAPQRSDGSSPR